MHFRRSKAATCVWSRKRRNSGKLPGGTRKLESLRPVEAIGGASKKWIGPWLGCRVFSRVKTLAFLCPEGIAVSPILAKTEAINAHTNTKQNIGNHRGCPSSVGPGLATAGILNYILLCQEFEQVSGRALTARRRCESLSPEDTCRTTPRYGPAARRDASERRSAKARAIRPGTGSSQSESCDT